MNIPRVDRGYLVIKSSREFTEPQVHDPTNDVFRVVLTKDLLTVLYLWLDNYVELKTMKQNRQLLIVILLLRIILT